MITLAPHVLNRGPIRYGPACLRLPLDLLLCVSGRPCACLCLGGESYRVCKLGQYSWYHFVCLMFFLAFKVIGKCIWITARTRKFHRGREVLSLGFL